MWRDRDFIRLTHGPCTFHAFNEINLSGATVVYGTELEGGRIRISHRRPE